MNSPTMTLSEIRNEWLWKFCAARRQWNDAVKAQNQISIGFWLQEQGRWASLLDLNARLTNELKGRTK